MATQPLAQVSTAALSTALATVPPPVEQKIEITPTPKSKSE